MLTMTDAAIDTIGGQEIHVIPARDPALDRLAALAADITGTSFAIVTLSDGRSNRVVGAHGFAPGDHLTTAFGAPPLGGQPLVIPDTAREPAFRDDPLVTDPPHMRFAASAALMASGEAKGALCVLDSRPRKLSTAALDRLSSLAGVSGGLVASYVATGRCDGELSERTDLLRTTLETMDEGIAVFSADGRLAACSQAYFDMLKLPPDLRQTGTMIEDIVRDLAERGYMGPGEPDEVSETILRSLRSGKNRRDEVVTPDGRTLVISRAIKLDGRIIITCVDVTARKEVEQMKDEFISTVSHELRTPLTSITGSLGLLMGGAAGDMSDRAMRLVQIAQSNAQRLTKLVNDLLDIDRIEVGRVEFKKDRVDLNQLARQVIDDNRPYGVRFGVNLQVEEGPEPVYVLGDADRLHQVMTNLLSNAVKFSPPGETVTLAVSRGRYNARLSVIDHGAGIPEQFHASIFRRFSKADVSKRRVKEGTGLGLAISRAIIERHGGSIGFKTAEGAGSTFFFELPALSGDDASPAGSEFRVLICEDDQSFGNEIRRILEKDGAVVDIAGSIGEALHRLKDGLYQALVVDLLLPDGHGLDLIREVRIRPGFEKMPVLVVSAAAHETRSVLDAGALNVVDWIDKTSLDAPRLVASLAKAAAQATSGRLRVLHVEDEPDLREVVSVVLAGFADVDTAPDLQTARRKLETNHYDVVILDVALPDGSGTELISDLSAGGQTPVPVVIFSATEPTAEILAKVRGALIKSRTSIERLAEVVRKAAAAMPPARPEP